MTERVTDKADRQRYEMEVNGQIVFADYRREGKTLRITHVEAPPALRGTGAAGRFMEALLRELRLQGLKVVPVCSYAATWIARHPEFQDLLA